MGLRLDAPRENDSTFDLSHHGDQDATAGLIDLAVNVRVSHPPRWLLDRIGESLGGLAAYPDPAAATAAVAARHARDVSEVLLTSGAAEAFVLIARAFAPRRAVVVHPQFTEPEAALAAAGHRVERVLLDESTGFALDPALIPADADLVIVGNPTNPTAVVHPAQTLAASAAPGRVLVVDEAFMDAIPGEGQSLASTAIAAGHPNGSRLLVIRSLTKTWGLAGLRIGYVLGDPGLLDRLRRVQPLWSVSSPALAAAIACSEPHAVVEADELARRAEADRRYLEQQLATLPGVRLPAASDDGPRAPFVLIHARGADQIRLHLRGAGFALRRGDTFPGLGPDWLRIAVRKPEVTDALMEAWPR